MRAGRLRHYVAIEAPTTDGRTSSGATRKTWSPWATKVPCSIEPVSGREFFSANQEQRDVTAKIFMRTLPGLTTAMRIVYAGAVYDIKAILPDPTGLKFVVVMCTTGASPG